MRLYGYFRSSAAYRVRIALLLKGLEVEHVALPLRSDAQRSAAYLELNPLGLVPTFEHDSRHYWESLAIIEYLEETYPEPPLLPRAPPDRAFVRAIALAIASDVHPLNNLRVLRYLKHELGVSDEARDRWYAHWVHSGLAPIERILSTDERVGAFCFGDRPGLADLCLVPQIYNAERLGLDLSGYPTVMRIVAAARALPAFAAAAPERQADAEAAR